MRSAAVLEHPSELSADDLAARTLERRAVETVIWGMPAVNYDLMYEAAAREAKGGFNQVIYWSRLPDWKIQTLTPNPDAIYLTPFITRRRSMRSAPSISSGMAQQSSKCRRDC